AHDAEGLALVQIEGDAVDGLDRADLPLEQDALGEREVLDEVADLEDGLAPAGLRLQDAYRLLLGARLGGLRLGDVGLRVLRLVGLRRLSHGSSPSRSGTRWRSRAVRFRPARSRGPAAEARCGRCPAPAHSAG